jgi:hypothetical protein
MLHNCSSPSTNPSRPNTNHEDRGSLYPAKCNYPWLRAHGIIDQETTNCFTLPNFVTSKRRLPDLNPVKMKSICLKYGLSANRAVNTLYFGH